MVDIHTHILPGIDDGARHWQDAYRMAALAADCGVDTIVCTHHSNIPDTYHNYNDEYLDELFEEFQYRLKQGGFPLKVVRGMEIFCTADVVEKIEDEWVLPIGDTDYYLVEFGFFEGLGFMEHTLYDIMRLGKKPIIAHPERYIALQDQPDVLYYWMRRGVLSQINRGSLQGRFGRSCQYAAEVFMDHNMVTCIASDAHRPDVRTTDLGSIFRDVSTYYSRERAIQLLDTNPRAIVEGRKISHHDLIPFNI